MKNQINDLDYLLRRALSCNDSPDRELADKVNRIAKGEKSRIKISFRKRVRMVAAAVAASVLVTTTAFAAWKLLSPDEVAEELDNPLLAEAFRSEDAVLVNETQSQGGYDITFLGIVSGKGLNAFEESLDVSKSYGVVAIAKQEGEFPDPSKGDPYAQPFFVSPLIIGQKPWQYNIASMNGGYSAFVKDGILYHVVECDSVEIFADRGLELIVSSTTFYSVEAYHYDEASGTVTPNRDFDGINMIFDLPIDPSKGDYDKAEEYLSQVWDDEVTEERDMPAKDTKVNDVKAVDEPQPPSSFDEAGQNVKSSTVMSYEEFKAWTEKQLEEGKKWIEEGKYSESSLQLDRNDYNRYLKEMQKEGAVLTLVEYESDAYGIFITYPNGNEGFITELDESGGVIIRKDDGKNE